MIEEIEEIMDDEEYIDITELKAYVFRCVGNIWGRIHLADSDFSISINYKEDTKSLIITVSGKDIKIQDGSNCPARHLKEDIVYNFKVNHYTPKIETVTRDLIEQELDRFMSGNRTPNSVICRTALNSLRITGRNLI